MVRVPDPRESAQDRDGDRKICEYSHRQHRTMIVLVVDKNRGHFEH